MNAGTKYKIATAKRRRQYSVVVAGIAVLVAIAGYAVFLLK